MPFDLSTAQPVKKGFDLNTARPVDTFNQQSAVNAAPVGDIPEPGQPQQPDITQVPAPPFAIAYNLFRGAKNGQDISNNAQQMGFEVQPAADGGVLMKRGDEVYRYDPDSVWSQFVSSVRPTAQTIGNVAGAALSAPAAAASGPLAPAVTVAGSTVGGTAGGQLADSLVGLAEPRGTTTIQELGQAGQDLREQAQAGLAGDVTGRAVGAGVKALGNVAARSSQAVDAIKSRIEPTLAAEPTDKTYQQLVDNIAAKKVNKVAPEVKPNLNLKQIAEGEGIYLNPSHYSRNPVYVETEQGLKARPGSLLNAREQAAITRMGEVADEIKTSIGGYTDKSQLNADYTNKVLDNLQMMRKAEENLYGKVSAAAPKGTKVNPKNTLTYLNSRIKDLGGEQNLTPEESRVFARLQSGKVNLALLDETRRQVGEGYDKQGPFKNASDRILDNLYGSMARDQEGVAKVFGMQDIYEFAKKFTQDRTGIEKSLTSLYGGSNIGEGLSMPVAARLDSAVTNLTKGNINDFRKVISLVPSDMRQGAVATSLDSLFTNGARNKNNSIGQGFIAAYESLDKNKAAKAELYKYIPPASRERLENLYEVAKGIYSAKRWENTSGTARAMLANMDKDASGLSRLYDFGKKAGAAEAAGNAVGLPGAGTVMTIATTLANNQKTAATKTADALIASPAFEKAIQEHAKEQYGPATKALMNSKAYQNWLNEQPVDKRLTIGSAGLFSYLFGAQSTDTPPPTAATSPQPPATR